MGALDSLFGQLRFGGERVPVMLSDSELECGAACLTMVLAKYGRTASLADVHDRCHVGRDGATALDIARAARSYGLRVIPYSLELDELEAAPCPAIMHWGFAHFVVLERFDGRRATIVDPGRGRRRLEREELARNFTGVLLTLAPGQGFAAPMSDAGGEAAWRMLARQAFRAPGTRRLLTQALVGSLLLQLLGLFVPLMTRTVINSVIPLDLKDVMAVLGLGILIILLTQLVLGLLRGLILVNLSAKLDGELMTSFFEHLISLPFHYFQERSTGDLLQRLSSNVQIRDVLSTQTISAALDGSFVLTYALVMILVAPLFGAVAIFLGFTQIVLLILTGRRMTTLVKRELVAQADAQSFLVESIAGVEALKAAAAEQRTVGHWSGVLTGQLEASIQRGRLTAVLGSVITALQRMSPLILLWLGTLSVLQGSLNLGTMLALVSLAQLFLAPLGTLVGAGFQIQQVGGHLERIASVLRVTPEEDTHGLEPGQLQGAVRFENVSFRYDESSPWVVRNIDLEIRPGQRVALVGRTGSGKSTLVKLLLGFYEPTEGRVLIEGKPLSDLSLAAVRSQIGLVPQTPIVFNGSIRRNISFNDTALSLSAIERAAALAELQEDIAGMPMGMETIVSEGGSALSGGQRQRLALARALAHEPRILILDEATSQLDTTTERRVAINLRELEATILFVAHRLSTVESADLIIVLEHGREVERGVHDELVAQGGVFAELVSDDLASDRPVG